LTDAVYLSMAKSEAATEIVGERPLRGGGRIRLRRALRGPDALSPYGGGALLRLGHLPDPSRALRIRLAADRALFLARRRVVWAAAGLLLIAAAAGERSARGPQDAVQRAAELVQVRQPLAALAELDSLAETKRANEPEVQVVRGKAEHALGQMGLAFSDFAAAAQKDPKLLDAVALLALADELDSETFPALWRPALVRLLGETVGRSAAPAVRRLLGSARAASRDDALQVLELAGAATDADRLGVARADLTDARASCPTRKDALRRLALVGDAQAEELLTRAASGSGCGSAEARDALHRWRRARVAETN
jgi:tetratricopeptide (TPR) repeat protein